MVKCSFPSKIIISCPGTPGAIQKNIPNLDIGCQDTPGATKDIYSDPKIV